MVGIIMVTNIRAEDKLYYEVTEKANVYKEYNYKKNPLPAFTLSKGDVILVLKKVDGRAKIRFKNKEGWISLKKIRKMSDIRNMIMNELEVISELKDIEPILIFEDYETGKKYYKYIKRSFMTSEFVCNIDKESFEKYIEIYYTYLRKK